MQQISIEQIFISANSHAVYVVRKSEVERTYSQFVQFKCKSFQGDSPVLCNMKLCTMYAMQEVVHKSTYVLNLQG
jgi:hypothetical protein